jgi:hypothetical protein
MISNDIPHTFFLLVSFLLYNYQVKMEFMSALGGSQEDAYRPSLFELVAQEKLKELLQPAVQYLLAVRSIVCIVLLLYAKPKCRFMLKDILVFC